MSSQTRSFYLDAGEPVFALFDDRPASGAQATGAYAAGTQEIGSQAYRAQAAGSRAHRVQAPSLHAPGTPVVGVLLCPLFGNADLCAYRARREWAKALAAAGHPTLRIDLPGTGDSPGCPYDSGLLESWDAAIAAAAAWLRSEGGCTRVTAIGIALGGLLVHRAACGGAAIDDLVLWSAPSRGRTMLRQLRALSQMEASHATDVASPGSDPASHETDDPALLGGDPAPGNDRSAETPSGNDPILPEGALAVAGFVLSAETVAALEALDLTKLTLPDARRRHVLLLDRDGLPVEARLQAALEATGAQVTVAPGPGYGEMVAPPQQSRAPQEVFATVCEWLSHCQSEAKTSHEEAMTPFARRRVSTSTTLALVVEGRPIRETPIAIARDGGQLVGVMSEPEGEGLPVCGVLLNAGALRRIGPNRMWVETARRWAARGVPTLRIDLAGIGDSDGDAAALEQDEGFYVPRYIAQTHEVLGALAARGMPRRFVLGGLCSGAYWAFHAALEDESVRGAFMVNPRALFWHWSIGGVRDARNLRKALYPATWRKLVVGQITHERMSAIAQGTRVALASLPARMHARRRRQGGQDELGAALARLAATGTQLLAIFTDEEPVYDELARQGDLERMRALPNVRVESIPGPITSHTLEPLPLQRAVHELLDAALERALADMRSSENAAEPAWTTAG